MRLRGCPGEAAFFNEEVKWRRGEWENRTVLLRVSLNGEKTRVTPWLKR
jgi:hypothetical protein